MKAKFASCALVIAVASLFLSCVNGQRWTFPVVTSQTNGAYPAVGGTGSPGARSYPGTWKDGSGKFWVFGGHGFGSDSGAGDGDLNDMWVWNYTSWVYWGGATAINTNYQGFPGYRENPTTWVDSTGTNLYLFGGNVFNGNYFNDLWVFNTGSHAWTRLATSNDNSEGSYPASAGGTGTPAAQSGASAWVDSGNFWMFGGTSSFGDYNNLWKYTPATPTTFGAWTWYNGAKDTAGVASTYPAGTTGAGQPGARSGGQDFYNSGVLTLFGGVTATNTVFNDMWQYTISSSTWTYTTGGTKNNNDAGTYTQVGSVGIPKARGYAAAWTDVQGNYWLFGGQATNNAFIDDFWKYSAGQWTWVAGTTGATVKDVYSPAASAYPGSRGYLATWVDNLGQLSMYDGQGFGLASSPSYLNQIVVYNGAPLLTTTSVSSLSTASTALASTSTGSVSTSSTRATTSAAATTAAAANVASTSSASTVGVSSTSSVSSVAATILAATSSTTATQGAATGSAATSSSTVAVATSTVGASSSSTSAVASTNGVQSTQTVSVSSSASTTATTFAASSTSTVSNSISVGGSTVSTQTASTSATASTTNTVASSTTSITTGRASTSSATIASTNTVSASSSTAINSVATATSSSTTDASQSTSFASLSSTLATSTSTASASSTAASSSSTSKATTIGQAVSSSSSISTTANTHVTSSITVTTTVATTATRATSTTTSTQRTTSSTSLALSTSTSTTKSAGNSLSSIYAVALSMALALAALLL